MVTELCGKRKNIQKKGNYSSYRCLILKTFSQIVHLTLYSKYQYSNTGNMSIRKQRNANANNNIESTSSHAFSIDFYNNKIDINVLP